MNPIILIFILLVVSCVNPTDSVKPEVVEYKNLYSKNIQTYEGIHRKMGFAWSGDPVKRPLVFVHGSPGSWEGWSHFLLDSNLQKYLKSSLK